MAVGMIWHGREFEKWLDAQVVRGLEAATVELHRIARKKAGILNQGVRMTAEEIERQAREQLGERRNRGLVRLTGTKYRKGKESLTGTAWYKYDRKTVADQKTHTVYLFPSRPGESPRRRTGFGQKNIVFGVNSSMKVGRVGFTRNARYMTFHELGIRYRSGFQQRPTLVPALRDNLPRLREIFRRAAARGGRR